MKRVIISLSFIFLLLKTFGQENTVSQSSEVWSKISNNQTISKNKFVDRENFPENYSLFNLDLNTLKSKLFTAQNRFSKSPVGIEIELPNIEGKLERFKVYEDSNFDYELQARFPNIRAYYGIGINDKSARLNLSINSSDMQSMIIRADKATEFIELFGTNGKTYAVYNSKSEKGKLPFTCSTKDVSLANDLKKSLNTAKADTGKLLNFRLAISCDGEYANYFGATSSAQVGNVIAAYNKTLTRVNGVFQGDFGIKLTLVNSSTNVIFYDKTTDPYKGNPNSELQSTLDTSLTGNGSALAANNAAYDVGHLFSGNGSDGNAGCIGCVCTNSPDISGTKGSGYTAFSTPTGDAFDIDFVAHEIGHQFGGSHTFSHSGENNSVNFEPASGSTIMGYAGITDFDVQPNSDDYFHAGSIDQVQKNMISKMAAGGLCASTVTSTPITHSAPIVNAGLDYTIPKSTPFVLTGSATDAGGGQLTYCWEQYNDVLLNTSFRGGSNASTIKVDGPNFKSYSPSVSGIRYFPKIETVLNGTLTTGSNESAVEALSSVARILNFRLTVRDNVANGGQTNFDDTIITVDESKGPFKITSQKELNYSYPSGSTQTVTWTVNGTETLSPNIQIQFSSNDGSSWSTIVASTPNDGSETINLPAGVSSLSCRFLIKSIGSIFYNISSKFAVGYNVTTNCSSKFSNNTTLIIPDLVNGFRPVEVSKTIDVSGLNGSIKDVKVTLGVNHQYAGDVLAKLVHPDGTQLSLLSGNCRNTAGLVTYNFSDESNSTPYNCTNLMGSYLPISTFNLLKGKPINGTWKLVAFDIGIGDTGSITDWNIEFCSESSSTLSNETFSINDLTIKPIPNNGNFNIEFTPQSGNVLISINDLGGRLILQKEFSNNELFNEDITLSNATKGVYLVTVENGNRKEVKKIIVQ